MANAAAMRLALIEALPSALNCTVLYCTVLSCPVLSCTLLCSTILLNLLGANRVGTLGVPWYLLKPGALLVRANLSHCPDL